MKLAPSSQAKQGRLDAALDRGPRLRATDGYPLPIREGQHRMAQKVPERRAGDGDAQFIAPGEVGLHRFARSMHLSEEDFLVWTGGVTPPPTPPPHRPCLCAAVLLRPVLASPPH